MPPVNLTTFCGTEFNLIACLFVIEVGMSKRKKAILFFETANDLIF